MFFTAGFRMAAWAPLIPDAKARTGIDAAALGLLLLCLGTRSIATMPLAGGVVARFGCRRIFAGATATPCPALPVLFTSVGRQQVMPENVVGPAAIGFPARAISLPTAFLAISGLLLGVAGLGGGCAADPDEPLGSSGSAATGGGAGAAELHQVGESGVVRAAGNDREQQAPPEHRLHKGPHRERATNGHAVRQQREAKPGADQIEHLHPGAAAGALREPIAARGAQPVREAAAPLADQQGFALQLSGGQPVARGERMVLRQHDDTAFLGDLPAIEALRKAGIVGQQRAIQHVRQHRLGQRRCASAKSLEFAAMWREPEVQGPLEYVKHIRHATLGAFAFELSTFAVDCRPDLSMVLYNPATADDLARMAAALDARPVHAPSPAADR